jgi:diguanylate cyclase (GGDEF)-like protein
VDRLRDELSRAERHGHQLSLIMMDIDGLKGVNDQLGHLAGDDVIVDLAQALRVTVRTTDTCARYGGDEFAVIAPHTDERAAAQLAQRILERARGVLRHDAGLSLGVAGWPNGGHTALTLIAAADAALYASKRAGGDRVTASAVRRHSATA